MQVNCQRLEAENAKLRDSYPDIAAGIEAEAEIARLHEKIRQLQSENAELSSTAEAVELRLKELVDTGEEQWGQIEQLNDDLAQSRDAYKGIEQENSRLLGKIDEICQSKELEILRALNEERQRFDSREERLLRQITELEGRADAGVGRMEREQDAVSGGETITTMEKSLGETPIIPTTGIASIGDGDEPHPPSDKCSSSAVKSTHSGPVMFANQLPPLRTYKGDTDPDAENVEEWLERFEMLAEECRWTPRAKLLHLTSRLEKQAYVFYRSCALPIRGDYKSFTTELRKRFYPCSYPGRRY